MKVIIKRKICWRKREIIHSPDQSGSPVNHNLHQGGNAVRSLEEYLSQYHIKPERSRFVEQNMGKRNPNRALQERRNPRVDRSRYLANIRERNSSAAFRTSKKAVDGSEGNTSANEMVTGIDPVKQGVQSEERGASRTRNERKAPESRTEKKARTPLSKATLETSDPSLIESQEVITLWDPKAKEDPRERVDWVALRASELVVGRWMRPWAHCSSVLSDRPGIEFDHFLLSLLHKLIRLGISASAWASLVPEIEATFSREHCATRPSLVLCSPWKPLLVRSSPSVATEACVVHSSPALYCEVLCWDRPRVCCW